MAEVAALGARWIRANGRWLPVAAALAGATHAIAQTCYQGPSIAWPAVCGVALILSTFRLVIKRIIIG